MLATNPVPAQDNQSTAAPSLSTSAPTVSVPGWLEFSAHLARRNAITGEALGAFAPNGAAGKTKKLRDLWELTELSSNAFADEVARFFRLPRLELPQLMAASSLAERFSRRFLRDMAVFPCQAEGFGNTVVMADPTDTASRHAVELVLGEQAAVAIASFEDIATALSERLDEEPTAPQPTDVAVGQRDNDVESLRDLASGAPVVRAVNDLLEKALQLRATDIHVEPFRTGLLLRMRVDGLLRPVPTPVNTLPQALISRIKILAGLNIAERRLPQDGAAHVRIARSDVDIRVATMPTQHGESAVIRLLPKDRGVLDVTKLGLSGRDQEKLKQLLELPHGIIVVTGRPEAARPRPSPPCSPPSTTRLAKS
jgi:general secretion pathway protein E